MNTSLGRTECAVMQNKTGGVLVAGDVVVVDTANATAVVTTTTSGYVSGKVGVIMDLSIANNAWGIVAFTGYVSKINLSSAATIGQFIKTHTVAKQGIPNSAPAVSGNFAQALTASATPEALLFGFPITVPAGGTSLALDGWIIDSNTWTPISQAYTNDPAAGSNIVLNMTDTSKFIVNDYVIVSSSAGTEMAQVVALVVNTSITVSALALNHTTTSPLVIAFAFTTSADETSIIQKGYKIKFTQSTVKYAVVTSITATTMKIAPSTDYLLTTGAVSANYYSPIQGPLGFPDFFNFTGVYYGNGSMGYGTLTANIAKYSVHGRKVHVEIVVNGTTSGSASTAIHASTPVPPKNPGHNYVGAAVVTDGGGANAGRAFLNQNASLDVISIGKYDSTSFGIGAGRVLRTSIDYEMA